MQPGPPAESDPTSTSWNNFYHLVLEIIAELSPCSEPKLFIVAATRGLERFGDGSLSDLSKLLSQCAQELQVRGLVEINGEQLVIAHAGCADENILDLTTEVVGCADENILDLTTEVVGCADENILDLTTEVVGCADENILDLTTEVVGCADENILDLTTEVVGCADENILDLTTEVVGCADENILDLTTEVVGCAEEDILDLTGCTERAPEPTRETIAAIRRLIETWSADPTGCTERAPEPTREETIAAVRRSIGTNG